MREQDEDIAQPASLDIPPDVERRYQELQEEVRKIDLSPATLAGESHAERFERRQRLRVRRREFEANARYPIAGRRMTNPATIAAMIGITVMLCLVSFGGGVALSGLLNRPPDISGTASNFWSSMESRDYALAHSYLNPNSDLPTFSQGAQLAQTQLGDISKVSLVPKTQVGGTSKDTTGKAQYSFTRSGGTCKPAATYTATLLFYYSSSNGWLINDYGSLLAVPLSCKAG